MYYNLPTHMKEELGDVRNLKSLWLGPRGVWYGISRNGRVMYDFQGIYGDLDQVLASVSTAWEVHVSRNYCTTPNALLMAFEASLL